jgi:hypothetical protein
MIKSFVTQHVVFATVFAVLPLYIVLEASAFYCTLALTQKITVTYTASCCKTQWCSLTVLLLLHLFAMSY